MIKVIAKYENVDLSDSFINHMHLRVVTGMVIGKHNRRKRLEYKIRYNNLIVSHRLLIPTNHELYHTKGEVFMVYDESGYVDDKAYL
jgi:hypothetical protein